MACRSCDLKRIYKLFEEKKRREAEEAKTLAEAAELERKQEEERVRKEVEEAAKRARKKKAYEPVEAVIEAVEEPVIEEVKEEISVHPEVIQPEESFEII